MSSSVRLSVCLSVTFVRPTQTIEIFGNVSMLFGTLAIHDPPANKILATPMQQRENAENKIAHLFARET